MPSNTKERLLGDLDTLRRQLAELEALNPEDFDNIPTLDSTIPLDEDGLPLLDDGDIDNQYDAIQAHKHAMANLSAKLETLDSTHLNTPDSDPLQSETTDSDSDTETLSISNATSDNIVTGNFDNNTTTGNRERVDDLQTSEDSSTLLESDVNAADFIKVESNDDVESNITHTDDGLFTASELEVDDLTLVIPNQAPETTIDDVVDTKENDETTSTLILDDSIAEDPKPEHSIKEHDNIAADTDITLPTHSITEEQLAPEATELETVETAIALDFEPEAKVIEEAISKSQESEHLIQEETALEDAARQTNTSELKVSPSLAVVNNFINHADTATQIADAEPNSAPQNNVNTSVPNTNSDDNPFLPAHLREKLNKSKNSLLEGIAKSSESLDATSALLRYVTGADSNAVLRSKQTHPQQAKSQQTQPQQANQATELQHQELIDSLVAKYLPVIEADLRQRLQQAIISEEQTEPA